MKRTTIQTTKAILASAAVAGLLSGGFLAQAKDATEKKAKAGETADAKKGETHDCKGKNSCKNKGGCKTGDNGCASKNSCKGKGGCAVKDGKPNPPKEKKE
jgi:hypothetical protein